jgi:hypothetical protein
MKILTKAKQLTRELDTAKLENQRLSDALAKARKEIEDMHVVLDAIAGTESRQTVATNPYNRKALTLVQRVALLSLLSRMANK